MNWIEERIEWKHNLRAEMHYNFVLKKRSFKRLAIFYVEEKTRKLKEKIAKIMFEKNVKKGTLKKTFNMWKHYTSTKRLSKLKIAIADQHFRCNFQTEQLKYTFVRWKTFTYNRKAKALKIAQAIRHQRSKLLNKILNAFFRYINYRRMRRAVLDRASQFYYKKLKQKTFDKLVSYRIYKFLQRHKMKLADDHYRKKLLFRSIQSIWSKTERRHYKKQRLETFHIQKMKRTKLRIFKCWKMYLFDKNIQQQKFLVASELYDTRCKKKYFRKIKIYCLKRRMKRKYQAMKIHEIQSIFHRRKLLSSVRTWKEFVVKKKFKREKLFFADINYEGILKKNYFHLWIQYLNDKKLRRYKAIELQLFHYHKILEQSFDTWKRFSFEKQMFKLMKTKARKYYEDCLIKQTFKMIIRSASKEKENKLELYLEREKRRVILAQTFLRLWRHKTKFGKKEQYRYCNEEMKEINNNSKLYKIKQHSNKSMQLSVPKNFIWDPLCFAEPRIPEYMQEHFNGT